MNQGNKRLLTSNQVIYTDKNDLKWDYETSLENKF